MNWNKLDPNDPKTWPDQGERVVVWMATGILDVASLDDSGYWRRPCRDPSSLEFVTHWARVTPPEQESVRVRFHDAGPLPPMSLEDEAEQEKR